ncbi:MAG TPA: S41 family peptidase [Acidobacteriaceae bacterium]|nr:S41 family peptidase [Acidobacteriaceae bacterium]
MRIAFFLALLVFNTVICRAQSVVSAKTFIPAAKLQGDVSVLRSAMEKLHPGLYRYRSKKEMDRAFDRLSRDFRHGKTLEQVYLRLSIFAAQIRCGHTYLNPSNQPEDVRSALIGRARKLPFLYRWVGQRMVVTRDFTPGHLLPRGTEIVSVNSMRSADLLTRLMEVSSADGGNDAKRVALSEETGDSVNELPDIFFPVLFGDGTALRLRIRRYGERQRHDLTVSMLTSEQRAAAFALTHPDGGEARFTLTYMPDGAALITMPTWVMYHSPWDWRAWLNASFDEIIARKSPALVLDIRGNTGGDDVGSVLLSRLAPAATPQPPFVRLVRYRRVPDDLLPYLSTWDSRFKDWGNSAVDLPEPWPTAPPVRYFRQIDEAATDSGPAPPRERFRGRVYVLTDASNSSATFMFARTVQEERLGTLVGGPTGGNRRGINGGAFFFLTLPNSHLEIDLPLIGYFPQAVQADGGVQPDVEIEPTIRSLATGEDPVLAQVMPLNKSSPLGDGRARVLHAASED